MNKCDVMKLKMVLIHTKKLLQPYSMGSTYNIAGARPYSRGGAEHEISQKNMWNGVLAQTVKTFTTETYRLKMHGCLRYQTPLRRKSKETKIRQIGRGQGIFCGQCNLPKVTIAFCIYTLCLQIHSDSFIELGEVEIKLDFFWLKKIIV